MGTRKIGFDRVGFDGKFEEDDNLIWADAIIASEIVHKYPGGWAYKPADELDKAAQAAEAIGSRPITILHHPDTGMIQRASDVYGKATEFRFAKDLMDAKTKRPCRKGIRAKLTWRKDRLNDAVLEQMRNGSLRDVSIGFPYEEDRTPGEWEGLRYDFVQRNIFIDHIAAPVEAGRCPGPVCGIAVDTLTVALDPWEETEQYIRSGHRAPSTTCRTKTLSEEEGIKAIICQYGETWEIQSYLFSRAKGWTVEKARQWYESHKGDSVTASDCPICSEIERAGLEDAGKRLAGAYGEDALKVIRGEGRAQPPPPPDNSDDLIAEFQKAHSVIKALIEAM